MCYSIPARLIKVEKYRGVIDYFGEKRRVNLTLIEACQGDYIYSQGGIAVRKVPAYEAEKILSVWKRLFFSLKKKDEFLSSSLKPTPNLKKIFKKIENYQKLNIRDILFLLSLKEKEDLNSLFSLANRIRQNSHGNSSCIHGIIEFSNYCKNNCLYCGIRKESPIKRYRMSIEEIIEVAKDRVERFKFKALVLQSGEDFYYTDKKLEKLIKELKKLGILIILSIGTRSRELFYKLFKKGARGVLLRFETANQNLFSYLRPETCWQERYQLITYLKRLGYVIASGFIMGLPKETREDILRNILLLCRLNPHMYSLGPFIPSQFSPLKNASVMNKDTVLKVISIIRCLKPKANILVTTALETLDREAKKKGLLCGANSLMINLTPSKYQKLYSIYDKETFDLKSQIKDTLSLLYSLGRAPTDLGFDFV